MRSPDTGCLLSQWQARKQSACPGFLWLPPPPIYQCYLSGKKPREEYKETKCTVFSLNGFTAGYFAIDRENLPEKLLLPFEGISSALPLAFSRTFHLQRAKQSCSAQKLWRWPYLLWLSCCLSHSKLLVLPQEDLPSLTASHWICNGGYIEEEELVCFLL